MSELSVHEVLVAAKRYLLNHGWGQGEAEGEDGRVCVMGAINRAISPVSRDAFRANKDLRDVVADRLGAHLGFHSSRDALARWNDAEGRTFDEVIDAFDRAIFAAAPKDARVEVTA